MRIWICSVFRPTQDPSLQLSGISRIGFHDLLDDTFITPDRDGILEKEEVDRYYDECETNSIILVETASCEGSRRRVGIPYGYRVHAHCWDLIERFIGPHAEDNLHEFLQVLCDRWREENAFELGHIFSKVKLYAVIRYEYNEISEAPALSKKECQHYDVSRSHFDNPQLLCNRVWSDSIIPLRDPLNIPQVHYLIERCKENGERRTIKRKSRKWRSHFNIDSKSSGPSKLPLDIRLLIIDLLTDIDIRNALKAFGWIIPDAYWKARLPTKIVFELDKINDNTTVDWKSLCLKLEEMLRILPELRNRQRILRVLETTKKIFEERLDAANIAY